jgi:hypothetical protein
MPRGVGETRDEFGRRRIVLIQEVKQGWLDKGRHFHEMRTRQDWKGRAPTERSARVMPGGRLGGETAIECGCDTPACSSATIARPSRRTPAI